MLIIMKLFQKTHRSTKIKITIKEKYHRAKKKSQNAPPNEKESSKKITKKNKRDMQDYVKPTLRESPDQIIVHIETNELASNKHPEQIAKSIISVATSLKSDTCDVLVSSITVRNDQHRKKVTVINIVLKQLCKEKIYILYKP